MLYNYQNDPQWKDETMAIERDTIGQYGCLVTCIANILDITPSELNNFLKANKGYFKLLFPDTCQGLASILIWQPVIEHFGITSELLQPLSVSGSDLNNNSFLIGKMSKGQYTYHFVNILEIKNSEIKYFDVWDGKRRSIDKSVFVKILKIKHK